MFFIHVPEANMFNMTMVRQRAFRERKEKHVKDLEAKLAHMEAAQQQASVERMRDSSGIYKKFQQKTRS